MTITIYPKDTIPAGATVLVISRWSVAPNSDWFKARFGDRGIVSTTYIPDLGSTVGAFIFQPSDAILAAFIYRDIFAAGAKGVWITTSDDISAIDWSFMAKLESGAESVESFAEKAADLAKSGIDLAGGMLGASAWLFRNLPTIAGIAIGAGLFGFLIWAMTHSGPKAALGATGGAVVGAAAAAAV